MEHRRQEQRAASSEQTWWQTGNEMGWMHRDWLFWERIARAETRLSAAFQYGTDYRARPVGILAVRLDRLDRLDRLAQSKEKLAVWL
ncbi:Mitochondrial translation optimization protein 1 [Venturia inaequalis]|nr:Mitochondrial translation optimization protein 1 [Venturia inaequalis]